jgi:hypothetical protein
MVGFEVRRALLGALVTVAGSAALAGAASAGSLPPTVVTAEVDTYINDPGVDPVTRSVLTSSSAPLGNVTGPSATSGASVDISGGLAPKITVSANAVAGFGAAAAGEVTYYFSVTGPIIGLGVLAAEETGSYEFTQASDVGDSILFTGGSVSVSCVSGSCQTGLPPLLDIAGDGTEHSYDIPFAIWVGAVYKVDLSASVLADSIRNNAVSASGFFDPLFSITDDRVNPADYTFSFSDGVLGSAGVPEPGTWALMLAGFAGLGLALRRRLSDRSSSPSPLEPDAIDASER